MNASKTGYSNVAFGYDALVNVAGVDGNVTWRRDARVNVALDWETLTECDTTIQDDSGRMRFDEMTAPGGIYRCSYCGTRQKRRNDGLLVCRQCGGELE